MKEKRIYSLNLAAFVMARAGYEPDIRLDENTNTYYCVYPNDNPSVIGAIYDFKKDNTTVTIQTFLKSVKHIRTAMHCGEQKKRAENNVSSLSAQN